MPPDAPAVRALAANGIIAWVSETPDARLSRDVRDATRATIEHDRVVGTALAQGVTPIPASLADPYESDAAALADIAPHVAKIEAALHEMDGMVEMTTIIAVSDTPPAPNVDGRGRAYLEQLRSLPSRAAAIADRAERVLAPAFGTARRRADGGRIGL
ncbi:MAG: GvpL/GvpF family gas vesicle protein, partial [Gemmatimonadaceae bacterium]